MPKLNILVHKSYHPYLEKNKQRVREDEAKAAAEELALEQKRIESSSSARLDALRRRANSPTFANEYEGAEDNLPSTSSTKDKADAVVEKARRERKRKEKEERKKRDRLDFDFPSETARRQQRREEKKTELGESSRSVGRPDEPEEALGSTADTRMWESDGHLNFFTDIERKEGQQKPPPTLEEIAKKKKDQETDPFTMYLGRPDKETKPWYTDRELKRVEERELGEEAEFRRERDRRKDARAKNRNDPLTQVNSLLSAHPVQSMSTSRARPPVTASQSSHDPHAARLAREQSERQRALALIAKSKATPGRGWDDTPSSVGTGGWSERFEREKDRAGHRYFTGPAGGSTLAEREERRWRDRVGGRSWEV